MASAPMTARNEGRIAEETALDGIDVIPTNVVAATPEGGWCRLPGWSL